MDDRSVVAVQIGREPRSSVVVRTRCHLGLPVVIDVPPILDDGTPFPTTHWLTCPLATTRISRIESAGGVRAADNLVATDPDVALAFAESMARYEQERNRLLPEGWDGPVPSGGIAGSGGGVKCLHAQYADTAAGNMNPIGEDVASEVEPLGCLTPCVVDSVDGATRNEAWTEPT
jgi:hypothetical protein